MRRPLCSPRHARHCSRAHAALVAEYRAARDASDTLRESGALVPSEFAYGASVSFYQLEPSDLARAVQRVTFKQWLISHRRVAA